MHKILKVLAVLSLIGWVATFVVSVEKWGSKVDAPIRQAAEAEHVDEVAEYLSVATKNAVELSGLRNFSNPEFVRWLALVSATRDNANLADSSSPSPRVMEAFEATRRLAEYEMPPFGVSLPGNPWLFWGWGLISLVVLGVSAVAGRKASTTVHGEPTRQPHLHAWHAD